MLFDSPFINREPTIVVDGLLWLVVAAVLAGGFLMARRRPDWGLASLITAAPFYQVRGSLGPLPVTGLELWLAAVLLGILSRIPLSQWRHWRTLLPGRFTPWLGLWAGGSLLAAVLGPDLREGLGLWRAWFFEPALWFVAARAVFAKRPLTPLLAAAIGAVAVIAVWAAVLLVTGGAITYDDRFRGPFQSANFLGLFTGPLLLMIAAWPTRQLLPARIVALGVGAGMMLASNSRGSQLALAAGLLAGLAFLRGRLLKLAAIVVAAIVLLSGVLLGPRLLDARIDPVRTVRPQLWQHAASYVTEDPLFGVGPGRFQVVFTERVKSDLDRLYYVAPFAPNAHNLVLVTWTEWGLLTVLGLLGLLVAFARTVLVRLSYWQAVPVMMMTAILIHGLIDTTVLKNDLAFVFWLAVLLAASVPVARQRRLDRLPGSSR